MAQYVKNSCAFNESLQHFLDDPGAEYGLPKQLNSLGLDQLIGYRCPGDVRALQNLIIREYFQSVNEALDCHDLLEDNANFAST